MQSEFDLLCLSSIMTAGRSLRQVGATSTGSVVTIFVVSNHCSGTKPGYYLFITRDHH